MQGWVLVLALSIYMALFFAGGWSSRPVSKPFGQADRLYRGVSLLAMAALFSAGSGVAAVFRHDALAAIGFGSFTLVAGALSWWTSRRLQNYARHAQAYVQSWQVLHRAQLRPLRVSLQTRVVRQARRDERS